MSFGIPSSALCRIAAVALCCLALAPAVRAQANPAGKPVLVGGASESGPRWQDLSAAQRTSLRPLERDWSTIDAQSKQKWLEIAARYPAMPPAEQQRVAARMSEWVKLSPAQRGQARMNYQEARQVTKEERQARWQAYQALTPEQRGKLAARAAPPTSANAARNGDAARKSALAQRDGVQAKSNLVPNTSYAAPPRAVGPTVVQAQPGATTSLISKRPAPPPHQQPGLPKIAATPGFVDKATLLPQRGPQGAAAAATLAPATTPTPKR
ncbi:DUF3106 domain-containing protein [Rhizobacter sp. AJA081-3]|uniref:DUF3106 domain-containing protein n=1 Tax=Rhizobacter sp. AJA081-3 TaxID=2753607 RepID=UPI001AE0407B|nr:DUF3106 domain-containing protein [Rhizobacter sp. AJA081-3]QTN25416.1 DUF3106 domain-containing protein [Rhizobacter sp. AJA081-3]